LTPEDDAAQTRNKIETVLQTLEVQADPVVSVVESLLGFTEAELNPLHIDPEQLKRQLFWAIKEICQGQCRQRPLLVIVEDFQWADAASVELLHALVDRVGDAPLLLILVARPSVQIEGFSHGKGNATILELQPLIAEDSEQLLDNLLGPLAAPLPL